MGTRSAVRFAVVGGGLGGTMAAILLQQAGHDVKVYEQAPGLARIGAGINLSPNVMLVMRGAGIEDKMRSIGFHPQLGWSRDWDTGEVTHCVRYDQFQELYGAAHLIMHRGDLQQGLTDTLAPGALELGKRLIDLENHPSFMRLRFADGTSADADVVIGADGINSRVREILIGPEKPEFTRSVAYRAIYPTSLLQSVPADFTKWWAEDGYILFYFITRASDELYFVTGNPQDNWDNDEYSPVAATKHELRAAFEGYHPEVQELIAACPAASKWPVLFRDPYPLWSSDRIVLLGDACHPMKPHMGQGAAMAMEDAAMLVRCITHVGAENYAAAFRLYETQRFDRTTRVKLQSDKHEWMRYGSECDWLYGYDVFNVPLIEARAAPDSALARA